MDIKVNELQSQLSCPMGEFGIEVGKRMAISNEGMIYTSINNLNIKKNNSLLEIGHGNCSHLNYIFEKARNINYIGLEISDTMHTEAKKINVNTNAKFELYKGDSVPFSSNSFDYVLSVNTIYFWNNPQKMFDEIQRVLKPGGECVITYVNKEFMKSLPFVGAKFCLHDENSIRELFYNSRFESIEFIEGMDGFDESFGENKHRVYTIVKLK